MVLGVVGVGGLVLYNTLHHMSDSTTTLPTKQIYIGTTPVVVELATSDAQRELGLSGRVALNEGTGMLFVFDEEGMWGFWMKDMQFPIDILFLADTGEVISLNTNVSPDTYPQVLYPSSPVRYVLELPAGAAQKYGIAQGSKIVL